MEFRFRASEERVPSLRPHSSLPDGYLAPQQLRVGIAPEMGRADLLHPASALGALRRELQKERIREEIIAREITERRILEEEVRREIEFERTMGIRRMPMAETMMLPPLPQDMVYPAEGLMRGPIFHVSGVTIDEGRSLRANPNAVVGKELALVHHKTDPKTVEPLPFTEAGAVDEGFSLRVNSSAVVGRKLALVHRKTDPKTIKPLPIMEKVLGNKRKGAAVVGSSKLTRLLQQSWACALCHVTTTSEDGLNDHLQGKKHRSKLALLGPNSAGGRKNGGISSSVSCSKRAGRWSTPHGVMKMDMKVNGGKMHQVLRKDGVLWCERCRVKCNSTLLMVDHLSSKRHIARMGEADPAMKDTTTSTETAMMMAVEEGDGEDQDGTAGETDDESVVAG